MIIVCGVVWSKRSAVGVPVRDAHEEEPPQLELVSEGWQTWTGVPEGYRSTGTVAQEIEYRNKLIKLT